MGTSYRVTVNCPEEVSSNIADDLERIDQQMSTYLETSTLSQFNRAPAAQWIAVSPEMIDVVGAAAEMSQASGGAFDVTVGPLVNLWGFGPTNAPDRRPRDADVSRALARVGYRQLEYRREPPALRKLADIYVDLSAIAKGYAVDRVAERLSSIGCSDYLIEVGGEIRALGMNALGEPWRIGIEVSDPGSFGAVQRVLPIRDRAVATSGDYRNFLELEGERFSHTIDPRTGYPVHHGLASVTVVHTSALWADGYATLLSVMGAEAGMGFAEQAGLAVLFVEHTEKGLEERYTSGMRLLLGFD